MSKRLRSWKHKKKRKRRKYSPDLSAPIMKLVGVIEENPGSSVTALTKICEKKSKAGEWDSGRGRGTLDCYLRVLFRQKKLSRRWSKTGHGFVYYPIDYRVHSSDEASSDDDDASGSAEDNEEEEVIDEDRERDEDDESPTYQQRLRKKKQKPSDEENVAVSRLGTILLKMVNKYPGFSCKFLTRKVTKRVKSGKWKGGTSQVRVRYGLRILAENNQVQRHREKNIRHIPYGRNNWHYVYFPDSFNVQNHTKKTTAEYFVREFVRNNPKITCRGVSDKIFEVVENGVEVKFKDITLNYTDAKEKSAEFQKRKMVFTTVASILQSMSSRNAVIRTGMGGPRDQYRYEMNIDESDDESDEEEKKERRKRREKKRKRKRKKKKKKKKRKNRSESDEESDEDEKERERKRKKKRKKKRKRKKKKRKEKEKRKKKRKEKKKKKKKFLDKVNEFDFKEEETSEEEIEELDEISDEEETSEEEIEDELDEISDIEISSSFELEDDLGDDTGFNITEETETIREIEQVEEIPIQVGQQGDDEPPRATAPVSFSMLKTVPFSQYNRKRTVYDNKFE